MFGGVKQRVNSVTKKCASKTIIRVFYPGCRLQENWIFCNFGKTLNCARQMSKKRIIEPEAMSIRETDVVSGWMYLKFLEDYKEYDKKQKDLIFRLKDRIGELEDVIEEIAANKQEKKLAEKLVRQKETNRLQGEKLRKLKAENEELLHKLTLLKQQLQITS